MVWPDNVLGVQLTVSWQDTLPAAILRRYAFLETRNAAAILRATNPVEFNDLVAVLEGFSLSSEDILTAGGNETDIAARLNAELRQRGWHEVQAVTKTTMSLRERAAPHSVQAQSTTELDGYFIDNVKGRVAMDVEWNAKDGNLDRDLSMYRSLYDSGFIDVAIMITREHTDLRDWGQQMRRDDGQTEAQVKAWLGTSTTTNVDKLQPRVEAGGAGGCPFLAVAITKSTWQNDGVAS